MNANSRMFWNVRAIPAVAIALVAAAGDVGAVEHDRAGARR